MADVRMPKDGRDGSSGKDGLPGRDGRDGQPGKDGMQGPMGPVGPMGPRGPQGLPGRDGKDAFVQDEELRRRIDEHLAKARMNVWGPNPVPPKGDPGVGVPTGGTAGQVIAKLSGTDFDTAWSTMTAAASWGSITGTLSSQTDLQAALDAKAYTSTLAAVATTGAYSSLTGTPSLAKVATSGAYGDLTGLPTLGTVASTAASTWAFNATSGTASSTTFLRGDQTWAAPPGGSDPWTYVTLATDFWTSSATVTSVPLFLFAPVTSQQYDIEGQFLCRTSTATVGPRPALIWPSALTYGVATLYLTSAAGTQVMTNGNSASTQLVVPVGGLPDVTGWYPGYMDAALICSASTSGNMQIGFCSETGGTFVGMKAGSFFRFRTHT